MIKFKAILLVLVCLASCQKQKEAVVAESRDSGEALIGEEALTDRIEALNSSRRDELDDNGVMNRGFENVIWWDANRMMGFGHNKRILFYKGEFIIHDFGIGVVAYGQYNVDDGGRVVCNILNRHIIEKDFYTNEEYYKEFLDYYKLFLENDTITFTVKHDPNLYYNQWQLISDPGGELYIIGKDEYTKVDMIYYNDGVELYKYDGGIQRCLDRLNVREKPSLNAMVICVLEADTYVDVAARTTVKEKIDGIEDYWCYVNYAFEDQYVGVYGYVFGAYLTGDGVKWPRSFPE